MVSGQFCYKNYVNESFLLFFSGHKGIPIIEIVYYNFGSSFICLPSNV